MSLKIWGAGLSATPRMSSTWRNIISKHMSTIVIYPIRNKRKMLSNLAVSVCSFEKSTKAQLSPRKQRILIILSKHSSSRVEPLWGLSGKTTTFGCIHERWPISFTKSWSRRNLMPELPHLGPMKWKGTDQLHRKLVKMEPNAWVITLRTYERKGDQSASP